MVKCKICQRYIEGQVFLKSEVCSAICFGVAAERERITKIMESFDVDKELVDYEGDRTEFVKIGMALSLTRILKRINLTRGGTQ